MTNIELQYYNVMMTNIEVTEGTCRGSEVHPEFNGQCVG